jgi:hypothetical protein
LAFFFAKLAVTVLVELFDDFFSQLRSGAAIALLLFLVVG